ncbi:hypothetical protein [Streptomyces hoynatensis]|uniref:Uncharacterized protein n=1 Tax=Streptomyces hoynatensis TaxID=1141874 RepID=A0A3A9YXX4_9ACTN|nr:hypothetical protein [Streptomyces hoynatensis]RKN40911.1 hypothetical protein D7294_17735 [Streptomyces hoynatensis]
MIDNSKAALATGIASGYLLGRGRKAKLAFAVASFVVSRKIGMTPGRLALHGAKRLKDSPQFAALTEQLRQDLLHAGKSAATAAASQRLGSLADAVQARTRALGGRSDGERGHEEEDSGEQDGSPEEAASREAAGNGGRHGNGGAGGAANGPSGGGSQGGSHGGPHGKRTRERTRERVREREKSAAAGRSHAGSRGER